jgi:tetratricopeptide repeat protein 8
MEKFALALSRFRRNKFDESILICDELLKINPDDLAVQLLKTHGIRRKNYVDDLELDEEGLGEMLLDDNKLSSMARPGTSLMRPGTSSKGISPMVRPISSSGRPLSGIVRPQSSNRKTGVNNLRQQTGNRVGTSRAITSGGRHLRLATASLQSLNSSLSLNLNDINPKNIVKKKSLARAITDYLFYVAKNFKKFLEICSEATAYNNYTDWWWKYQLGKVYYKLGMLSEAEKQLISANKQFGMFANVILLLSHVYTKMDQPIKAIEILSKAITDNPGEMYYVIYQARIQEMLGDYENSMILYKNVLSLDNCNFEAIACIGSHHFYSDQPEIAMKFYKRLFELGINSAEIWNNLGLCAYYSSQYDFCLSCFERALFTADSDELFGDIWYNISNIAIGIGDLPLAYQALKISITYNGQQFEAFNNIAILEIKKGNTDQAKSNLILACRITDFSFEPYYNYAVMRYKQGDLEEAQKFVKKSLEIFPDHFESKELREKISKELLC